MVFKVPDDPAWAMKAKKKTASKEELDALHAEVHEGLFRRLDVAFPEFGWKPDGRGWVATDRATTKDLEGARPDRFICHKPQGYYVHGGRYVLWMDHVNNGVRPRGGRYIEVLRELAARAGVDASILDREASPEERERHEAQARRRGTLESVLELAQEILWSERGEAARAYLRDERGLEDGAVRDLGLGLYPDVEEIREKVGADAEAAAEAGVLFSKMTGFIAFPWMDAHGLPLTCYGRWPGKPPLKRDLPAYRRERDEARAEWEGRPEAERAAVLWAEPAIPKTMALPGEKTKGSPLYLDRALRAGHADLVVAVEGVLDAALLQATGDRRVVAYVGAQFSDEQIKTLKRHRVRKVVVVPDPDGGGAKGAVRSAEALERAGIASFVAPTLPDGLDPDEFLLRDGLDAWKTHVNGMVSGAAYRAERLLDGIAPTSPDRDRRGAVERVLDLHGSLRGPEAKLDGVDVLTRLADRTGYPLEVLAEQAESVAERRRREALERDTKKALREAGAALEKGTAPEEVLGRLAEDAAALRARTVEVPPPFSVARLDAESANLPEGKSLGWDALDELDVALHPGELALLAGRTGHGKTSVMVNLFLNLLRSYQTDGTDEVFVFYSAEEPEVRIYHRLLALITAAAAAGRWTPWTANEVRDFILSRDRKGGYPDSKPLDSARNVLRAWESRLLIVHRPAWSVADIEADARRVAAERTVGGVFVDYLQRISPPKDFAKGRRRDEEISAIGRRLKILAEDLRAPVVAGAQINRRSVEGAGEKIPGGYGDPAAMKAVKARRPQLHHLREGGSEQEADLVLGFLNYAADLQEDGDREKPLPPVTRLEVGVLKNRYGPQGRWVRLAFEGRYGWVRDRWGSEED